MIRKDEQERSPGERSEAAPHDPPVDPRKPQARTTPGSHSTGGARDHRTDREGPGR